MAFSTLTRMLESLRLEGPIDAGPGIFVYRFGGARSVMALWHPTQDATAKLPLEIQKAELVNAAGESRPVSGSTLALRKGSPLYVVLD